MTEIVSRATNSLKAYLIYSNKRRGAYLISRVSGAAPIRGQRLFKRLIPQRQNYFMSIFHGLQA